MLSNGKYRLVVFDVNDVLVADHTTLGLAKGSKNEGKMGGLIEKNLSGKLSLDDAIGQEAKLLRGVPEKMAEEVAENTRIIKGAREAIAYLKRYGCNVVGVSTGFFPTLGYLNVALGLDELIANELEAKNGVFTGRISAGPVSTDRSKADIIAELMAKYGVSKSEVVAVGGSANDISMFGGAGLRIAFNSKAPLEKHVDVVVTKKDLREVVPYVTGDSPPLSSSDVHVLKHLQDDASQPLRRLGEHLGMSPAGVSKKIKRLLSKGVINKFTIDIPEEQVGAQTAFIMAKHTPSAVKRSAERLSQDEHVVECYSTVDGRMLLKVLDHESRMEETLAQIFEILKNEGHEISELIVPKVHKRGREVPQDVLFRQLA